MLGGDKGRSTSIREKKNRSSISFRNHKFFTSSYNGKQWNNGFKMLKESNFQSRMLYPNYQTSVKIKRMHFQTCKDLNFHLPCTFYKEPYQQMITNKIKWAVRKRKIQNREKWDITQESSKGNPQNDGEGI